MIGNNQSFKKVFVTNLATMPSNAVKAITLPNEQLGIIDAKTNLTVNAPAVATNPVIYFQQGETSNGNEGTPYSNSLPNKTAELVRGKVTHWSGRKAVTGRNEKWEIKDTGGKCDEVKHLYIHLSGILVEQFAGLRGHTIHLEAQGPCCDACDDDNCDPIISCHWMDQFVEQLNNEQLPGGIPMSKVLQITKLNIGDETGEEDGEGAPILATECTLRISPAMVNIGTNDCYWDIFPYFVEPIFLKISTYDPDFHNYNCNDDQGLTITQTQTAIVPTGIGDYVKRQEVRSKMRDNQYRSKDEAVRFAENTKYFADTSKTYDVLTLGFYQEYKSGGVLNTGNTYRNDYMIDFYFETGEATAFLAAINPWVIASNPEFPSVSL